MLVQKIKVFGQHAVTLGESETVTCLRCWVTKSMSNNVEDGGRGKLAESVSTHPAMDID